MVTRDGKHMSVLSHVLVIGDIVDIKFGDRVPADIRLFAAQSLKVGPVYDLSQKGGRVEYVNTYMQELFAMFSHRVEQNKRVGRTLPSPRQITHLVGLYANPNSL